MAASNRLFRSVSESLNTMRIGRFSKKHSGTGVGQAVSFK
jgi:hypothetical protein